MTPASAPVSPTREKAKPMRALAAITRRSQASASPTPPPKASPLIRAMTGIGKRCSAPMASRKARTAASTSAGGDDCSRSNSAMSAPAQKCLPAPVNTSARARGAARTASTAAASSRPISMVIELARSGRLSVSRATASSILSCRVLYSILYPFSFVSYTNHPRPAFRPRRPADTLRRNRSGGQKRGSWVSS